MPPGFARRDFVFRLNRAEKRGRDGGDGVGGERGLQCARPHGESARDSRDLTGRRWPSMAVGAQWTKRGPREGEGRGGDDRAGPHVSGSGESGETRANVSRPISIGRSPIKGGVLREWEGWAARAKEVGRS